MSYFQWEYVKCGKSNCRSCPHGPYLYEYWWDKKTCKRYHGRKDPRAAGERARDAEEPMFDAKRMTVEMAFRELGLGIGCSESAAKTAFRRAAKEHHPDRGGDAQKFKRAVAAWTYLQGRYGWK